MLVFIDESGCPGFKLDRDSDPVFVIGMVTFMSRDDARETERTLSDFRQSTGRRGELKFSKCRDEMRDAFFRSVRGSPFRVRAVVVNKRASVASTDGVEFYRFFANELLKLGSARFRNAVVRIDGSSDREAMRAFRTYLSNELRGQIRAVRMVDSVNTPLIQLADMCVGAIARAYRDRPKPDRWLEMLRPRIEEIREFK